MPLIVTTIAGARAHDASPGTPPVLDCFELAFDDVTEIILCEGEMMFVRADGTIVHSVDDDRLTATDTCPRCPARAGEGETHTCQDPTAGPQPRRGTV